MLMPQHPQFPLPTLPNKLYLLPGERFYYRSGCFSPNSPHPFLSPQKHFKVAQNVVLRCGVLYPTSHFACPAAAATTTRPANSVAWSVTLSLLPPNGADFKQDPANFG